MTAGRNVEGESGRSSIVAAVLSAVIPGAGQWYARRFVRGALFFAPFAVVGITAVVAVAGGVIGFRSVLSWAVQPALLKMSLIVNGALLVWRVAAVVDAYRVSGGRRSSPHVAALALGVLVILVAAPQMAAASYTVRGIALLETVFVAEEKPKSTTTVLSAELTPEPVAQDVRSVWTEPVAFEFDRSARNLVFRPGIGDPEAVATWAEIVAPPTPEAPFLPFAERVGAERLTILLVGGDEGPGREGLRTDSMIVATVDVNTGEAALFGLPRNFKRVPLPDAFRKSFVNLQKEVHATEGVDKDGDGFFDHWTDRDGDEIPDPPPFVSCRCFPVMLNRVHQYTKDWTGTYPDTPDPGLAALRDVIANLIDLPIDYYMMVNMEGFVDVIDAIGGVEVMVTEPYHVAVSAPSEDSSKAKVNVEPGLNRLTGLEALAYSRWRIGSSDYDRMQRQRCLIRAAADQADPLTVARSFHTLADVIERSVVTDIPLILLPDLVDILGRVDMHRIATVGLVPPRYNSGRAPGGYPIPNVSRIRSKVAEVLEGGVQELSTESGSECGT
ncbi:MAG: LCP family protein [Acidimicrobiia bacterium]